MIRRWSCLINLNCNLNNYDFFSKNHKIILFKTSVNFKKFSYKFTKLKRKSLIRLKHKTNWLIYTNILKLWSKDYIFNKNFARYQFYNKIFINNFLFYNFNFIKNRNENFFYNFNFIFSIFTHKNYSYFFKNKLSNLKNNPITTAWCLNNLFINNNTTLPIYNLWDNSFYQYNHNDDLNINFFNLDNIFSIFFSINIEKNIEIKKIIILLIYNKISNVK